MREEELAIQAARLRLLCKCLALTKPTESKRWLSEAKFFEGYLQPAAEDDKSQDQKRDAA